MTEQEWQACADPKPMLKFLGGETNEHRPTRRKLQMFACACCARELSKREEPGVLHEAVRLSQARADGKANDEEVHALAARVHDFFGHCLYPGNLRCAVVDAMFTDVIVEPAFMEGLDEWHAPDDSGHAHASKAAELTCFRPEDALSQANLLRHIMGNPFRPCPTPPSWPSTVVQLAESLYDGQDCAFALHDVLLEAGQAELAEHFLKETWHPKGCWAMDLILGKT